jgi:glycosyltransferase involved in cell wall biosynthesis
VVVTSHVDAAALQAINPRLRMTVVTPCVDLEYFRLDTSVRGVDTVVLAGKMSYHANATAACYFAREVFPLVRARRPEARLLIVGSDPPADVRALASSPGIAVTGHVPDVRPYLGQAAVAVAPMIVKVGIQNKVLEAMACGTPVVATSAGAEGLDVVPGQELLVADAPADLADHVVRALEDESLRGRLSAAGRRYVEQNHRWSEATRRLEEVYGAAIADGR